MKVAWVHSMRFLNRNGKYFGEAQITHDIWRRYLRHFDELLIVARKPEADTGLHGKYISESSGPNVTFQLMEPINSLRDIVTNSRAVRNEMRRALQKVDGVIARLPSEHGLAAIEVAAELGKPFAVELVGCAFDALWHHGDTRGKLYAPIMAWRVKQAVRKAHFVLYVTRDFLQKKYPARFENTDISNVELPTSVAAISDVDLSSAAETGDAVLTPERSAFVIGMAGAFQNEYKGHSTAFQAIKLLKVAGVHVRLKLIGVGDTTKWQTLAEKLGIREEVDFDGVFPAGSAVHGWMQRLDLYIQPSLTEGLPRALIEAMSNGKSALASSAGGIPELLEPACLHRPGDRKELARQILFAMRDPDWRQQQGIRNRDVATQYLAPVLDAKRNEFWSHFAEHCRQQSQRKAA